MERQIDAAQREAVKLQQRAAQAAAEEDPAAAPVGHNMPASESQLDTQTELDTETEPERETEPETEWVASAAAVEWAEAAELTATTVSVLPVVSSNDIGAAGARQRARLAGLAARCGNLHSGQTGA